MSLLRHQINNDDREYYIEKVNEPLLIAITALALCYPEPTMENVCWPDSKRLLEIRDKFLEYEGNERLRKLGKALFRLLIDKIEHSPAYRYRFSWLLEELAEGMKPRPLGHPTHFWNEPKPYGGR